MICIHGLRTKVNVVATVGNVAIDRSLRVEVSTDEPMTLVKPQAYRLLGGPNRRNWILPCTKGTNLLVLGDSQAKESTHNKTKMLLVKSDTMWLTTPKYKCVIL